MYSSSTSYMSNINIICAVTSNGSSSPTSNPLETKSSFERENPEWELQPNQTTWSTPELVLRKVLTSCNLLSEQEKPLKGNPHHLQEWQVGTDPSHLTVNSLLSNKQIMLKNFTDDVPYNPVKVGLLIVQNLLASSINHI